MKIRNEEAWQAYKDANAEDPYGARCVSYAEDWANLMEAAMASGETLGQCADRTSHKADYDGITGFMYGASVAMLSKCWEHGEELRRWHNHDIQIGDEGDRANESGGVLNPALISFGEG